LLAGLAVTLQRVEERANPAPADERNHDVDRVGRLNLGPQFVPDSGFPRCVGENRRIEERSKRPFNRLWLAVRPSTEQRMQYLARLDWYLIAEVRAFNENI
jgi:hypothetical protein